MTYLLKSLYFEYIKQILLDTGIYSHMKVITDITVMTIEKKYNRYSTKYYK